MTFSSMCAGLRRAAGEGPEFAEFSTSALYNALSFCDGTRVMFSQDDEGQQGLVLALVFGLVALVIALSIGVGVYQRHSPTRSVKAVPAIPVVLAPQPGSPVLPTETRVSAAQAAQAVSDAATVKVEQGIVKFYFA